jgi:flagellar FliJ protein
LERFTFRLENILKLRKKTEERSQLEFAKRRAVLLKVQREIEKSREKFQSFIRKNPFRQGTFTVTEIIAVDNYISKSRGKLEELDSLKQEKQQEVSAAMEELKEAKKARKVIERLKERKLEQYMSELNREEDNELDDVNQKIGINREKLTIEDVPLEDM